MSAPRSGALRALIGGIVLVLAGVAFWALSAVQGGREQHAYVHGRAPAQYVHLVLGHTYWLAVRGGAKHLDAIGVQVSTLQCTAAAPGQAPGSLSVTPETKDTKATDEIASFYAGTTQTVHIACDRIGAVYIEGDGTGGFDWSGLWLILATIALAVGIPLTLSGRRMLPPIGSRTRADDPDDSVDNGLADEAEDADGGDPAEYGAPSALFGSDDR